MGIRYAGIDWATEKHDVRVAEETGEKLLAATFAHDAAGLSALCRTLVRMEVGLVAIERPDGVLVERLLDGHALLDVRLETGRTHQIRVHLAAIGLPVAGDPVYGAPDPQLGRQFLHAWRLAFTHPVTGEPLEVESPLPPELQAALERFAS